MSDSGGFGVSVLNNVAVFLVLVLLSTRPTSSPSVLEVASSLRLNSVLLYLCGARVYLVIQTWPCALPQSLGLPTLLLLTALTRAVPSVQTSGLSHPRFLVFEFLYYQK